MNPGSDIPLFAFGTPVPAGSGALAAVRGSNALAATVGTF